MVTRKKPLIILLAAVLLVMSVLVFVSCSKEPEPEPTPTPTPAPTPTPTPETSMSHIIDRGQLVVAVEAAHPPYIYVKRTNGAFEYCGPEYELAKAVAEDLGVELVIKDVKSDDIYIGLDLGLYDLAVANITPTDEMRLDADFSTEYFKEEYPLMINKEFVGEYTDLNSFKDKRVGALRRTTQYYLAKDQIWYPRMKAYETETIMIDNLMTNYLAAICMESYRARYYIDKYPDLTYLGIALSDEDASGTAVAIPKGQSDMVEYINSLMTEWAEDSFLLKELGISETDYSKNSLEIDNASSDYLGILYGK